MSEIENRILLKLSIEALNKSAGRRTSANFSQKVIISIIESLKQKYNFLKLIEFQKNDDFDISNDFINIKLEVNSYPLKDICKCIEQIIRIIYLDLKQKAGVFFVKEFKECIGPNIISTLEKNGVDVDLLEFEQQHIYSRENQKKSHSNEVSLLGYSWKDVSSWRYDENNAVCILYNQNGQEMDKLNLDVIIKNHINRLSEDEEFYFNEVEDIELKDIEIKFIKLLNNKDLYIDTAINLLNISDDELHNIVDKLTRLEILHYTDLDVVSITEKGKKYLN